MNSRRISRHRSARCQILRLVVISVIWLPNLTAVTYGLDASKSGFSIAVESLEIPYRTFALYVDPDRQVEIRISDDGRSGSFMATASDARIQSTGTHSWTWNAPSSHGQYQIDVFDENRQDSITLQIFVLIPLDQVENGYLNGYRIGQFPETAYKDLDQYRPPSGLLEVTEDNQHTRLSPHFTLGQFICKQESDWPMYLILREELLLKLELLLQRTNAAGYSCSTFHVMSGFRTPYYNHRIGNVKYSRHQWGGAADIFVDEDPQDEMMDDLNDDGAINWKDAAILYNLIDDLYGEPEYEPYIGGLGRYKKTTNHGPFVHVDVRGFRARWGD